MRRCRLTVTWVTLTPDTLFALTVGEVPLLSIIQTPDGLKALVCTDREYYQ
jgi:hypothetical protein